MHYAPVSISLVMSSYSLFLQLPLRLGLPKIMPGLKSKVAEEPIKPPKSAPALAADAPPDLSAASFTSLPRIPCASVLVRIQVQSLPRSGGPSPHPAPSADVAPARLIVPGFEFLDSKALEAAIAPPPLYSDGSYDSTAATPSGSEVTM